MIEMFYLTRSQVGNTGDFRIIGQSKFMVYDTFDDGIHFGEIWIEYNALMKSLCRL